MKLYELPVNSWFRVLDRHVHDNTPLRLVHPTHEYAICEDVDGDVLFLPVHLEIELED